VCVCVCSCVFMSVHLLQQLDDDFDAREDDGVCVWESEREGGGKSERKREPLFVMFLCVYVYALAAATR